MTQLMTGGAGSIGSSIVRFALSKALSIVNVSKKKVMRRAPFISCDEGCRATIKCYQDYQVWWQPLLGAREVKDRQGKLS